MPDLTLCFPPSFLSDLLNKLLSLHGEAKKKGKKGKKNKKAKKETKEQREKRLQKEKDKAEKEEQRAKDKALKEIFNKGKKADGFLWISLDCPTCTVQPVLWPHPLLGKYTCSCVEHDLNSPMGAMSSKINFPPTHHTVFLLVFFTDSLSVFEDSCLDYCELNNPVLPCTIVATTLVAPRRSGVLDL